MDDGCDRDHADHIECEHKHCSTIDGFSVCNNCGCVVCSVPVAMEWVPGIDDIRQRCSAADEAWHVGGTTVGTKKLEKIHQGISGGNKQRVYAEGREFIKNVCTDLNVGHAVETEALDIFGVVREQHGRWRGARRVGILIACVSIACQKFSIGVTDSTILKLERVNQPSKTMNAQKKHVLIMLHKSGMVIDQASAETYCLRVCSELGLNSDLSKMVSAQAKRISKMEHLNARSCNMIVAVSVLFLVEKYNLSINVDNLCKIVNVTRPTLVKWYAEASVRSVSYTRQFIQVIDSDSK
jgi:transcription initiation factor TFIIIB Brf1 subunit/transcription initiation factor TFIIB